MPRKRKVPVVDEEKENDGELSQNSTIHHGPMYTIMSNVQLNETFHKKYIREMQQLYGKMDHDAFMFMFIKMIKSAMEGEETNEYAYTTLLFCAKFIAAYDVDDTHPVLADTCRWLLTTISQNPHIRFRLCQFVNMILNALGVEAALDDAICDGILEYMLRRLRDMNPNVRVQSILALQRLQCPDNPDDIVLRVYQFHLCADPSPRVRQAVITSMGRNYNTIPYILDRLWDIDEKVRRHTYLHMSGYPVKAYKVSQRLQLLEQGLNDRSEMVKKVVTTIMLPQWLESYNKNYIMFVSALKLDSSEAEVERFLKIAKVALREIFKRQKNEDLVACVPLEEEDGEFHKCVPHEKLTMEVTLYWQCLIDYLQAEMADELDLIIPELSTFCAYVLKFCESQKSTGDKFAKMEFQYILLSLCEILYLYDLGDEIGRGNLKKLISTILKTYDLEEKVIEVIVKCTENLLTDQNTRLQFFVEIIEEITNTNSFKTEALFNERSLVDELLEKHPDQDLKLKLSSLKVKIMDLEEQEMNYVEMKDYVQAQRITEEKNTHLESYRNLLKPLLEKHSMNSESSSDQSKNLVSSFQQQKKVTTETILKSLQLAFYMVVSKNVKTLTPNVCKLYKEFIGRHIASSQIAIRDWSLKCGTAYSMLYEPLAKEIYEVLYAQFFKNHNIRIWKTSITCIFELLDRYGCSSFNVEERQNKTKRNGRQLYNTLEFLDADDDSSVWTSGQAVDIIFMMSHFLDTCDDVCIISAIVNGFCRLVLHDHVKSADILEKLLLRYFNPSTDPEINQILGVFLENLIQRKKQEYLHPCLIPTISQVISAPYESPLHEIKPETILRFVIDATRPEFCAANANIHNKIALSLLQEMQNNIANKDLCKILSKEILTLEMSVKDDLPFKENLKGIAEKLINCEFDAKTLKNIVDFKDLLDGTFNPPPRQANLDGSDEEDKSDDETVSAITTERDHEKTVAANENTSDRLAPLLEDDKESEQETEADKEPVTQNSAPSVHEVEEQTEAEKEKESESENTQEAEKSKEPEEPAVEPSATSTTEAAKTPVQSSRQQTTPTTFGRENSTSLRYLRKSMNFSRQKSMPDEGPSPKIRIEARIDSIPSVTPPKVQKMNENTRQRRRNVRNDTQSETPVARNEEPTTSKTRHATRSSKIATTSNAASVGNKRKPESNEKDNTSAQDSDESDIIPPSPPSTSASESTVLRSSARRVNRTLRFNNIQIQKTTALDTKTNVAIRSSGNVSSTNAPIEIVSSETSSSAFDDNTEKESSTKTPKNKQPSTLSVTKSVEKRIIKSRNPVVALRRENNPNPANVVRKENSQKTTTLQTKTNETTRSSRNVSSINAPIELVTSEAASSSASEDGTEKESSTKTPKNKQQSMFIVTKSVEKRITKSRNPVLALRRRNNPSPANVVRKGNTSDVGSESAIRKTRKRLLSPKSSSLEGDKDCASPLRKQSKTSVNLSEKPETNATNNTTLTTKAQSPITNKLRTKNSNVPERSAQRKRSTRSAANKNNSPSSKENEPKPPSKRISSYQSPSSSADSSSSSEEEYTIKTPKNKEQSKLLKTKSVENRIMSSRNPVLNLQQTKNNSSLGRVSTRNSARKDRQNNMIMTRRRLSLEKTHSPSKTIITMSKSPVVQKKSTTSTDVPSKASKIPVRSNKPNTSLDKSKGSVTTSSSKATTEDSSSSSDDSLAQKNRGKTMLPQPKAIAQPPRVNSTLPQNPRSISTRPSRIVRGTRNADAKIMRRNKNI